MIVPIANVLDAETLGKVRELLDQGTFIDGKQTAGWHARQVKNNAQLQSGETAREASSVSSSMPAA